MESSNRARRVLRTATAGVAVAGAAIAALVANGTAASAVPGGIGTQCESSALYVGAPTPVTTGIANPASVPCATDNKTLVTSTVTVIPGVLGIGGTKVTLSGVASKTWAGDTDAGYLVKASSDIASLTVTGPGLSIKVTGIHSDAWTLDSDGGFSSGENSSIASLVVNGKRVTVLKNVPLTINAGLRTTVTVNQREDFGMGGFATALHVTFPDQRYYVLVAASQADMFYLGD